MLTRLSAMLPINTRGMWIGTFHGLCNRLLRTHYRDAALPQTFQILDSQDQLSVIKRLLKANNVDDEKFPAEDADVLHQQRQGPGLARHARRGVRPDRAQDGRAVRAVRRAMPARRRGRFRRTAAAHLRTAGAQPAAARALPGALPPHPGRRVPGYQRPAIQLAQAAGRAGRAGGGALFAVGDDDQSIYAFRGANVGNMSRLRARVPGQEPDQAGAELPLARPHPRQRQLPDRQQQQAPGQEPAHRRRPRRAGARVRSLVRPRRSAVDHRRSQEPDGRGASRNEIAILYRSQRAVARDRARAVRGRHSVHRVRRPALLPARRGQARDRLSAADGQSAQRFGLPARGELPHARHRHALDRAVAEPRPTATAFRCTRPCRT